jgi:hypothetical protein
MRLSKAVWSIGLLVFVTEIVFGYWMAHMNQFIPGDSLSRVANAYYVGYSRDPHLAAIGFVWNPLPSLLILPILTMWPLYPELASSGLAGVLLTGCFAAGTAMLLLNHFIKRGLPLIFSFIICLLFSFNPFIFLYGSNGMSESIFIFFLVWAVISLTNWIDNDIIGSTIFIAFSLIFSFLTRYEAVAFGACLALCVILLIWKERTELSNKTTFRAFYHKIEAIQIVLFVPVIFTGLIWIFMNYTIMGDPLYFLRSNYSNLGQSQQLADNTSIGPLIGNPITTAVFIFKRMACFMVPLVIIIVMRLWRKSLLSIEFVVLLLLLASIPAMQFLMLVKGSSYGWLRFFVYPLPLIMAWLPYELQQQKKKALGYQTSCILALGLLIGCGYYTWNVMHTYDFAPEEYEAIHFKESSTLKKTILANEIAADLDNRFEDNNKLKILMDSFNAFQIILCSKHPDKLVITSDRDFENSLREPVQYNVNFILVPDPSGIAGLNAVNQTYKEFYEKGASWATLEKDYGGGWKLYRVIT